MCGIVGVIGNVTLMEKKIFKHLLQMDVVRGKDSTGIFGVDRYGLAESFKLALTPTYFLQLDQTKNLIFDSDDALFGHNRAATLGGVNVANAHPFTHGDITLMHNGTLVSMSELDNNKEFGTDSETICYNINKNGAKETLERLDGAYALVWHDASDNSINFARNDERPLHYLTSKDEKTMVFSSEAGILYAAATKEGYLLPTPDDYIIEVPTGVLHKVKLGGGKLSIESEDFEVKKATPLGGKTGASGGQVLTLASLGLSAGTKVPAYISKFRYERTDKSGIRRGVLTANLMDSPFNEVILYNAEEPDSLDALILVTVSHVNSSLQSNRLAKTEYDVVLSGTKYEVLDDTPPFTNASLCCNCSEAIDSGDGYFDTVHGDVCARCYYGDTMIRDAVSEQGQSGNDIKYA